MITLKNEYTFQNRLNKDSIEFKKFQNMLIEYFDFTKEIEKFNKNDKNFIKGFNFLNIEFIKRGIVVEVKNFWWFRNRILIPYEIIIKAIQLNITKLNKENTIFGEKLDENNNTIYYIEFKDGNDIIYYENKCKIDLYLNIYDDIMNGTNPINRK